MRLIHVLYVWKLIGMADRFSVTSIPFAQSLHSVLLPHLPSFPYPASARGPRTEGPRPPHSCNSNIRVYKYTPDQYFGAHYDDSVRDPETGAKSEWTLLIYLTGIEDGVLGGEVRFSVLGIRNVDQDLVLDYL